MTPSGPCFRSRNRYNLISACFLKCFPILYYFTITLFFISRGASFRSRTPYNHGLLSHLLSKLGYNHHFILFSRGVCSTPQQLLDLCFALLDNAGILPYYFYLSDMTPNAEHWRLAVWEAQLLQRSIMGYLPGFATPRLVCDVPYLGKSSEASSALSCEWLGC